MPTLKDLFDALTLPPISHSGLAQFSAHPVPGYEGHRIGKDFEGGPCLLLRVAHDGRAAVPAPMMLSNLAVQHDVQCRLSRAHEPVEEAAFTLVRCLARDEPLVTRFLDVIETLVRAVGKKPTVEQVQRAVDQLAELFRSLDRPARKPTQGLWAELFLMSRAQDPFRMATAWHTAPEEGFDFSEGSDRIEVKSVSGGLRQHYFSLAQVHPPATVRVLVASIFVEALSGGTSVKGLLGSLRRVLAARPEAALRVESIAGQCLGKSWPLAIEESFDIERAEESLRFFEPRAIPAVPKDLPREVSDVRFRSDLEAAPGFGVSEARGKNGLFSAL